jgi:hypothetical protein
MAVRERWRDGGAMNLIEELAHNDGLGHRQISAAFRLLKENEDEIRAAREDHFGRRGS